MLSLNSVHSVAASAETDVYIVFCNITDINGETRDCDYCSRPDDSFGLNPIIRQWLVDHEGSYTIEPYVPPTAEQIRAGMLPLSRAAFRTAFKNAGMTTALIVAAIFSVDNESEQEDLQIAWEDNVEFRRLDPLVLLVADRAGKTADEIDAIWIGA